MEDFMRLNQEIPEWAWEFPPSIPFIGSEFNLGTSLLIYASAENLAWMNKQEVLPQFKEPCVWNRYRKVYDVNGRYANSFFPEVGIAPVSNGPLLCAGLFVAEAIKLPVAAMPREFLEGIAVSNLCKYSIHSANNVDYIDDLDKVRCSLPYVGAELRALQPGVILLPERAWMYREIADAIRDASPNSKILPAKQFNARVVNLHLSKHEDAGAKFEKAYRSRPLHG